MSRSLPGRRGDRGATLAELAVAVLVGATLLAATGVLVTGVLRAVSTMTARTATTADARIALEAVSRTLRVAYRPTAEPAALVSASPQRLSFWALLGRTGAPGIATPAPTLVTYGYDGRCLTQAMSPSASGPAPAATCLVRTTVPPVFTYYPAAPADGSAPAALPATPQLAAADLARVRSVRIDVRVQDPARRDVPPLPGMVQVTLQNLGTADGP